MPSPKRSTSSPGVSDSTPPARRAISRRQHLLVDDEVTLRAGDLDHGFKRAAIFKVATLLVCRVRSWLSQDNAPSPDFSECSPTAVSLSQPHASRAPHRVCCAVLCCAVMRCAVLRAEIMCSSWLPTASQDFSEMALYSQPEEPTMDPAPGLATAAVSAARNILVTG